MNSLGYSTIMCLSYKQRDLQCWKQCKNIYFTGKETISVVVPASGFTSYLMKMKPGENNNKS